jgi:hypothetical protein
MTHVPGWRNWQTRRTQNPVLAREWEFDPPSGHHHFNTSVSIPTISAFVETLQPVTGVGAMRLNRRCVSTQHYIVDVVAENILT